MLTENTRFTLYSSKWVLIVICLKFTFKYLSLPEERWVFLTNTLTRAGSVTFRVNSKCSRCAKTAQTNSDNL